MSISFGEIHVGAILLGLQFTIQPFDLSKIAKYLVKRASKGILVPVSE